MKVPRGIDRLFVAAASIGHLPMLQKIAKVFKNGEGPGEIPYAKLTTPGGYYAIHAAADAGKHSVCRFLTRVLKLDINATTDCTGETSLHLSISGKHRSTTIFLIDNGADVMKRNILGETPIHYAADKESKEIVKILLSKGADLNAISDMGMPLHAAARSGNGDVLKYLLDLKADLNPAIEMSPLLSLLNSRSIDIECMELLLKVGQTPLEYAASCGRLQVVELLFPVTSRNPHYPDWSIRGVMRHAKSNEARMLDFTKAAEAFSRALALDPENKEIKMAYMAVLAEHNKFSHWDEDFLEFEFGD